MCVCPVYYCTYQPSGVASCVSPQCFVFCDGWFYGFANVTKIAANVTCNARCSSKKNEKSNERLVVPGYVRTISPGTTTTDLPACMYDDGPTVTAPYVQKVSAVICNF